MSRSRSLQGWFKNLVGIVPFRCEDCEHRFEASIWRLRYFVFAKCPRCHRMDLSKWNIEHYNPPRLTSTMVALGARKVRCEYCRHNFWSFRFVKEAFSYSKRSDRSRVRIPASDTGAATDIARLSTAVDREAEVKRLSTVDS